MGGYAVVRGWDERMRILVGLVVCTLVGLVVFTFGVFMQLTNSDSLQQVLQRSDHDLTYWRRSSCILQLRLKENDAVNALLIR